MTLNGGLVTEYGFPDVPKGHAGGYSEKQAPKCGNIVSSAAFRVDSVIIPGSHLGYAAEFMLLKV